MSSAAYQATAVGALAVSLAVSLLDPPFPSQQILQHTPTVLSIALLAWAVKRECFSNAALTCLVAFMLLHVYGARYIYSFAPLGESLGFLALERNAPPRNHYDRLVHLSFGILALCPVIEAARNYGGLTKAWARTVAILFVFGVSALYESFEWLLTIVAAPELADRYNGQQGDVWDAQKDMALACLGAVLFAPFFARRAGRAES